jgi:hypothetical protein
MHKSRVKDQFLYALLAAVFAAIAVVVVWTWSVGGSVQKVAKVQNTSELMQELSKTVDSPVDADIQSLRQEASSL